MRVDDAPQEQLYAAVAREILPRLEDLAQCRSTTMDVVRLAPAVKGAILATGNWVAIWNTGGRVTGLVHVDAGTRT